MSELFNYISDLEYLEKTRYNKKCNIHKKEWITHISLKQSQNNSHLKCQLCLESEPTTQKISIFSLLDQDDFTLFTNLLSQEDDDLNSQIQSICNNEIFKKSQFNSISKYFNEFRNVINNKINEMEAKTIKKVGLLERAKCEVIKSFKQFCYIDELKSVLQRSNQNIIKDNIQIKDTISNMIQSKQNNKKALLNSIHYFNEQSNNLKINQFNSFNKIIDGCISQIEAIISLNDNLEEDKKILVQQANQKKERAEQVLNKKLANNYFKDSKFLDKYDGSPIYLIDTINQMKNPIPKKIEFNRKQKEEFKQERQYDHKICEDLHFYIDSNIVFKLPSLINSYKPGLVVERINLKHKYIHDLQYII